MKIVPAEVCPNCQTNEHVGMQMSGLWVCGICNWESDEDELDRRSIEESEAADPAKRIPWAQAKTELGLDGPAAGRGE